jgi:hypothetical protein
MDPYRRQISVSRRNQIVLDAFMTAGQRLKACGLNHGDAGPSASLNDALYTRWSEMRSRVNARGLRTNPDLADVAMDLVFSIEQQTSVECGTPTGKDLVLLLISRLREGS